MTPLDFVNYNGDSNYNAPVGAVNEAMNMPLVIRSVNKEWKVLSYWYDDEAKRMVIDIEKIK